MQSQHKILILLLGLLVVGTVAWFMLGPAADQTVYAESHSHPDVESHEHQHTHGKGIDHGHEHPDSSVTTHSHAHRHEHHHEEAADILKLDGDLTEIGHLHSDEKVTLFWAKISLKEGKFHLSFFQSEGSDLTPTSPTAATFDGFIVNQNELESRARFEKSDDKFVANAPADFLCLPTHVIKIEDLEFGGHKVNAVVSIGK